MNKTIITTSLFLLLNLFPDEKIYHLVSIHSNSELNYFALSNFDEEQRIHFDNNIYLSNAFTPIAGKYTIYIFKASFEGISKEYGEKTFHDILLLKASSKNKILDGVQFTLEWREHPYECDLHRVNSRNLYLRDNLKVSKLKLRSPCGYEENKGIVRVIKTLIR